MLERAIPYIQVENRQLNYFAPAVEKLKTYRAEKWRVIHQAKKINLAANQTQLREILAGQGIMPAADEQIDVYNPSNEFELDGETYLAGRTEPRGAEFDSLTVVFKKAGEDWVPLPEPVFKLQDPAVVMIGGELVLCGVRLKLGTSVLMRLAGKNKPMLRSYQTIFFRGRTVGELREFAAGPERMKDVRLVELSDQRVGVYTRPQRSGGAGKGQIGFTIINNLAELNEQVIANAPLLSTRFPEGEWGGVNEAQLLSDGRVFVLGHQAYLDDDGQRHYYSIAFIHQPLTGKIEDLGIVAERSDFPTGPAKRPDLMDVLFTAGAKLQDGRMVMKAGTSDAEVGEMEREMPRR